MTVLDVNIDILDSSIDVKSITNIFDQEKFKNQSQINQVARLNSECLDSKSIHILLRDIRKRTLKALMNVIILSKLKIQSTFTFTIPKKGETK